jgi:sulfate/thiosulfate transport system substrate-binding protein
MTSPLENLLQPQRLLQTPVSRRRVSLMMMGVLIGSVIAACSGGTADPGQDPARSNSAVKIGNQSDVEITLVSFAVTRAAHEAIIPKFVAKWAKETGQTVRFKQSYGGSGAQTRAVIDGLDADVVHLALGLDVSKIETAGLIQPGWEQRAPNAGIVSQSVAAIVTREGNPKGIQSFTDLAKDGVSWITADPKTSGIARWNFLAIWNAAIKSGASEAQAQALMAKAYKNVPVLTKDARESTDVFFKQGQGDALINYENEVRFAQAQGEKGTVVIPNVNISIDHPVAVVDKIIDKKGTRKVAEAFVQFLFTPEAQAEFAKAGFRPIGLPSQPADSATKFPVIPNLATVKDFEGWKSIQKKFFADGALYEQIQTQK